MTITTTGQKAIVTRAIIAGKPVSLSLVDVVSIDGETLTYTVDGIWFSTVTRDEFSTWDIALRIVIDGADDYGYVSYEGPVVTTVETIHGPAMVMADELTEWNPEPLEECPIHGAGCEAWA